MSLVRYLWMKRKISLVQAISRCKPAQAFRNLSRALAAAQATTADVVKIGIYIKHYQRSDAAIVGEALKKAFPYQS
jgi:hypothetical protein